MSSYVPVSSELHQGKRWLRHPSFEFAKHENVVPIFANELVDAIHTLPVAFIKQDDRFILVVLMGLRPMENLMVAQNGQWRAGGYKPVHYRTRPFMLLATPGNPDQQILCLEEANFTEGELGEPLFNEEGQITEVVSEIFKLLSHYGTTHLLTQSICAALAEHNVIVPWQMTIHDGETEQPLDGLYRIDEVLLNSLPDESFLALRKAAALPVAYAQLYSMNNVNHLSELLTQTQREKAQIAEKEEGNGTFNFAGL